MNRKRKLIFVAAENGALPGGKVGGVADVMRDLPAAMAENAWQPTVVTPSYGVLHNLPGATQLDAVTVRFANKQEKLDVWRVPGVFETVENLVFDHEIFAKNGAGVIYAGDEPDRPYATDANKFALFCAAVAGWIEQLSKLPKVVHLHDWHAAFYCLLQRFSSDHRRQRNMRTVFTIHNLAYQGTRPLRDDSSALETWFPSLQYDLAAVQDPDHPGCLNPMATAIRLADQVSTVSPTYAREICRPSDPVTGFVGGEGLETLLRTVAEEGRLTGVLNGCYYDNEHTSVPTWPELLSAMRQQVSTWRSQRPDDDAHRLADRRLRRLAADNPGQLLVSVGRLVQQKATLFVAATSSGVPALQQIANNLDDHGLLIILGSGEAEYELALLEIAKSTDNVLFLKGYADSLAAPLYELGSLFLMPSSFEPCGISQLLAMRAGLPCVVHSVGGLRDTVVDGHTGFVFKGNSLREQADGFVDATVGALQLNSTDAVKWQSICDHAAAQRFDWSTTAQATIQALYETQDV